MASAPAHRLATDLLKGAWGEMEKAQTPRWPPRASMTMNMPGANGWCWQACCCLRRHNDQEVISLVHRRQVPPQAQAALDDTHTPFAKFRNYDLHSGVSRSPSGCSPPTRGPSAARMEWRDGRAINAGTCRRSWFCEQRNSDFCRTIFLLFGCRRALLTRSGRPRSSLAKHGSFCSHRRR